jgi:hypothetical protein
MAVGFVDGKMPANPLACRFPAPTVFLFVEIVIGKRGFS